MISFLSKTLGRFFYYYGRIFPFRQIGLVMYQLSLIVLVFLLKKDKNIKAIYLVTNLHSPDFLVGKSDIDLLVIVNSMTIEEEIDFNVYFSNYEKKLLKIFPFLGSPIDNHFYIFEDNFKIFQNIRHSYIESQGKHFTNWKLLYGLECRLDFFDNETVVDGYTLRFCYEQILVGIYLGVLGEGCDFRMIYKYGRDIIRMFFILVNKKEAEDIYQYKDFLLSYGLDKIFIDKFFNLPVNKFQADKDFSIFILFNFIKIIEKLSEADKPVENITNGLEIIEDDNFKIKIYPEINDFVWSLNKEKIKSIYLSQVLFIDSYFLYLFIDNDLDFPDFKNTILDILSQFDKLPTLNNKIRIKLRSSMFSQAPDIFPLIITTKMSSYGKFFDYGFFLESVFFNYGAKKLFGLDIKSNINLDIINNKKYFYGYEMYNLRIESDFNEDNVNKIKSYFLMMDRLFSERKKLALTNITGEYDSNFGDLKFNFNDSKERYLFFRRYIKNNQS